MSDKAPAKGWQHIHRGLIGGELLCPLLGLAAIIVLLLFSSLAMGYYAQHQTAILLFESVLAAIAVYLFYITQQRMNRNLMEPLAHLRDWALQMRNGNLSARVPVPSHGEFAVLAKDINELGDALRTLSREMDEAVHNQTQRLAKKTRDLEVLYEVAANSNNTTDINDLLIRYLGTLHNLLRAEKSTVRLLTPDDNLILIGSIGFDKPIAHGETVIPIERCLCAQSYNTNVHFCQTPAKFCYNLLPVSLADSNYQVIAIPLQYHKRTLGIYHCFLPKERNVQDAETISLLTNIAQHLSLAIEKERMEDESRLISIMQERTMLAHELHDSLAQTLASLRFRVSTLVKMYESKDEIAVREEMGQIKLGLDEANTELRELLAHFRIPMDERGLVPATQSLVEKFHDQTGISIFFQNECPNLKLPSFIEVQVLHIIQESLTNIRKHSKCENVRIILRKLKNDSYHILIEDDGVGIIGDIEGAEPGEHVGLNIMRERARRIDGELNIETEPGEGTRIELHFIYSKHLPSYSREGLYKLGL